MLDPAEFRSDHDPSIAGTAIAPASQYQSRIRIWALLSVYLLLIFGLATACIVYACHIYRYKTWGDLPSLLELMLPLGFVVWFILRIRLKTGRWPRVRSPWLPRPPSNKPASPQRRMDLLSVASSVLVWARGTALGPSRAFWPRAFAWIILAGDALLLITFLPFAIATIYMSYLRQYPPTQRLLFFALGVTSLWLLGKNVQLLLGSRRRNQL